jgi:hypothetical protein
LRFQQLIEPAAVHSMPPNTTAGLDSGRRTPGPLDARNVVRDSNLITGAGREIRPDLRFNDLRGSKVTEMVWAGISVPDLAIRIGWKIETAAKMLGVYAALNAGRAMSVALCAQSRQDDAAG